MSCRAARSDTNLCAKGFAEAASLPDSKMVSHSLKEARPNNMAM